MEIMKFKTNLGSREEVSRIASSLDKEESISRWNIDTASEDNLLSVSGVNLDPQRIACIVRNAGFKAEIIRVLGINGHEM
ncbi:copper chaperone [Pontibacter sp. SGAir0037]|uniref:copper chaperone n=1 Tax=Pontibacter sp. SGAir0037 TaxID=2571030 RepID=UPI0010CCF86A|nr:copper chaperone [Pontibacter sp. SGAir0037]QCR25338.1 hypothetical protein C1N53_22750 [Pontibacter sp. SGAir0037]